MAKIAMIGDIHAGARNDSPVFQDYLAKCLKWVIDYIDRNDIRYAIQLGDLMDRRKYLSYTTSYMLRNHFLTPLEGMGVETHIIAGNHDQYYRNTYLVNALDELVTGRYSFIKTYNTPKLITIDGFAIQLLPWLNDANRDEFMAVINKPMADLLIGHLELAGFEMYRGLISDKGDDRKLFDRFDAVYSGHYHHKSSVGNIHYLGALAEYIWSDHNDPRGIHIFDTATRKLEFVRNPHSIFKLINYDDKDDKDIFKKVRAFNYTQYKNCYVKVVCASRETPNAFDMLLDGLYKAEPVDVSVVEDAASIIDNSTNEKIDESADTGTILSTYIKSLTLPVPTDRMVEYMREVYVEALSTENV